MEIIRGQPGRYPTDIRSVINGWCKSQSRGEYKRVYQSNEINAYANEACYQ